MACTVAWLCMRWVFLSLSFKAGHECGDNMDLIDGRPTGAVRVSFGYMSTWQDAEAFVCFIQKCFVQSIPPSVNKSMSSSQPRTVQRILLYPIKSCAAFEVRQSSVHILTTKIFN